MKRRNISRSIPFKIPKLSDRHSRIDSSSTRVTSSMPIESDEGAKSSLNIAQCRNLVYESLIRDGKMDMLKSHLSDILRISGWNQTMRQSCIEYIKNEGQNRVNIACMLRDMVPFGRNQVSAQVRDVMRDLLRSVAQPYFKVENLKAKLLLSDTDSETYLPLEYQSQDKVPDYGDHSVFARRPEILHAHSSRRKEKSPVPSRSHRNRLPSSLSREIGGIVLLDRVDPVKRTEKLEKEKAEQRERDVREKERQERDRIRQELDRERTERLERERAEQRERERQEQKERQKERERMEQLKERERRHHVHHSPLLPSSPYMLRQDKKTETPKTVPIKQPPSLASTLITATAAMAGKKNQHIILNSDEEDDEDEEELMDI